MWQYNQTNYLSHGEHKYIAKVRVNGKNRYFYTEAEYSAYLKQQRNRQENSKKDVTFEDVANMTDKERSKYIKDESENAELETAKASAKKYRKEKGKSWLKKALGL